MRRKNTYVRKANSLINSYLYEGEAAAAADVTSIGDLVSLIEKMASGSTAAVGSFFSSIFSTIGNNLYSFATWIKEGAADLGAVSGVTGEEPGIFARALSNIGTAIGNGIQTMLVWIKQAVNSIANSDVMSKPLYQGSSITGGTALGFAALSAVTIFVIYKIYKAVKNRAANTVENNRAQLRNMKYAVNESIKLFDDLRYIQETTMLREGIMDTITGMINKAYDMVNEMIEWVKKRKVGNTTVGEFARNHPVLTKMILVCGGCIIAWCMFGGSSAAATPATPGVSTSTYALKATQANNGVTSLIGPGGKMWGTVGDAAGGYSV